MAARSFRKAASSTISPFAMRSIAAIFPIQNEQAYAALGYMVDHAEAMCLDGSRLAIVGDGAGGNMAAAVTLMAKRRRRPEIAFQLLLCPIVDTPRDTGSYATFADGPWLTKADMASAFATQFPPESPIDILARPLRAAVNELYGLPPALVITAENDVLRDEGESYARKLMQAGVAVTATRYIGTVHGFATLDGVAGAPPARAALSQSISALRDAVGLSLIEGFQNNPVGM